MPRSDRRQSLDDQLVRYLLGYLPEDEVERLDERSIVDDAFAARLRATEDELLDAYISGTLPAERRRRFASHYLASPRRRQKAEFARGFLTAVDGAMGSRVPTPTPAAATRPPQPLWWLVAAAAVVLLGIGALLIRVAGLQREVAGSRRQVASAERRADSAATELEGEKKAAALAKQALVHTSAAATVPPANVALLLMPQTRGGGPVPILAVPASASIVLVDLALDGDPAGTYRAALRDAATNRTVWRSTEITADRTRSPQAVGVELPARLLRPQHYAVDLFQTRQGRRDFVGTYTLEVVRR